ncbi:unnamed protein product [Prunus armeniaca]
MSVPHHIWGHAVLSAAYLINRTPSRVFDFKTPHDVFGDHVSPVSVSKLPLKFFGCIAYVHVYSHQRSKLDPCAMRCVFIGYSSTQKGYKCYHPPTQKVHVTLDVTFHEEVSYYVSHSSPTQGKGGANLRVLDWRMMCLKILLSERKRLVALKQVIGRPYLKMKLVVPVKKRLIALWNSTSRPCLEMKQVLLVSKRSVTLKQATSRLYLKIMTVILVWMSSLQYPLCPASAPISRESESSEEEIYIDLPPNIPVTSKEGVVCKLRKSLYGLKQPPRAWFRRFAVSMKKFGYVQSNLDHTLFLKRHKGKLTALIIYVDNMIVTGDDKPEMQNLQKYLASEFEMKSLGDLKYFLRIEVARSKHGIFLSQRKYILDLLAETGMLDCKPIDTPGEQNHKLGLYPDQVPIDKKRYQRLVGKLIYLSQTRPDIAYAVSVVS